MRGLEIAILKCLESDRSFEWDFIVICSSCKRVRDDKGYWNYLDGLWNIADKVFSHGLCPHCAKTYRAEIIELVKGRHNLERVSSTTLHPGDIP